MDSPDFTLPLVAMAEIERAVVVVTDTAIAMITKPNTKERYKSGLSITILWSRRLSKSCLNGLNKNVLHVLYNLYNSIIMIHFVFILSYIHKNGQGKYSQLI